jgi:hypothetical protein
MLTKYFLRPLVLFSFANGALIASSPIARASDLTLSPKTQAVIDAEFMQDLKRMPVRKLVLIRPKMSFAPDQKSNALAEQISKAVTRKYREEFGSSSADSSPVSFQFFDQPVNETSAYIDSDQGPSLNYLLAMSSGNASDDFGGPMYVLQSQGGSLVEVPQQAYMLEIDASIGAGPNGLEVKFEHAVVHGWMDHDILQRTLGTPIPSY